MKKKLFIKFFVLAAMVLFTVTACQNEDVVNPNIEDDIAMESAILQLDEMNGAINDAFTAYINVAHEQFELLTKRLMADPKNESLQKQVIAKGVQIEAITTYQTRAVGTYPTVPEQWGTSGGGMGSDVERRELHQKLNVIVSHLTALKTFIENNIDGSPVDLTGINNRLNALETSVGTLQNAVNTLQGNVSALQGNVGALQTAVNTLQGKVSTLEGKVTALENVIPTLATKAELAEEVEELEGKITALRGELAPKIETIYSLLGIAGDPPASSVLDGIKEHLEDIDIELLRLEDVKANKFKIEEKLYDLKDVYDELQDSLAVHRTEIEALKKRVTYIEEVELPAIWGGISILYQYIGDVYDNLDQRVTGLTFKPDYDFGPGLSSLILVRGISEWGTKTVEGGFGWQVKAAGSPYKGITWLTYNVSPANADLDLESVELVYTTTKLITRSASGAEEPLLKIAEDERYLMTFENGILRVPVLIHSDAYPLIQTSFDPDSKESIKVALRVKNSGITAPDEPTRPEKSGVLTSIPGDGDNDGDETDRSVVSSEYVTVWLGLFEGRVAEKDAAGSIGLILPTEIVTADFLAKDCSDIGYPVVTLWVGDGKPNTVTVADSVLAVFYDEFEKEYKLPEDYLFNDHELSYELVDLGNNANTLVSFTGSNGKIDVSVSNQAAATGKTLAVLVKAKVGDAVHALGYVRVIIAGPEKELITITPDLSNSQVTINCNEWTEFTGRNTVANFIWNNIINKGDINKKTNISTRDAFYQKYTKIEINSVSVTNSTASFPELTPEELKELVQFEYVTSGSNANNYYIKGTVSNEALLGDYTVVTTLSSDEYIPDLKITWKFSVRVPQLRPSSQLVNGQFMVALPSASPLITASYSGTLNSAFLQQNGQFNYNYLNPNGTACPDFITPDFIFKGIEGYEVSDDGKTLLKDGVPAAVIVEADGIFTISLNEVPAAHGLVGNDLLKVEARGTINGGEYITYPAFNVYFLPPLSLVFPTNASFSNNQYSFNFYMVGRSGSDIIRTWDGLPVALKNNKEGAKLLIDYYGINYQFDQTYQYGNTTLGSPLQLDLDNITYASGSSNTFSTPLSELGATVTVLQFNANDVEQYFNILTPIRYKLRFNANGATLPGNLRISIPVTMEHRWGFTVENLEIRVN